MTMLLKKYLRKKLNNLKYCLGSNKYKGIFQLGQFLCSLIADIKIFNEAFPLSFLP